MACPASGTITIQDLVDEFGGSTPHSLSEYYRDGDNVPGNNTNVPTSGAISLSNFYSAVNEIQISLTSDTQDYSCSTGFGSNWTSTVPKKLIIASGVTVGATGSNNAITLESGMAGTFTIENSGNIYGFAGAAGTAGANAGNAGGNGGNGGDAISVNSGITSGVTVTNNSGANIKGGGGGGGGGGAGGAGGTGGTGGQGKTFSDSGDLGSAGGNNICGTPRMADYNIHCFSQDSDGYWQGSNLDLAQTTCGDETWHCRSTYGDGAYCGNCWPPSGSTTVPTSGYTTHASVCCPGNYSTSSWGYVQAVYGIGNCDECHKTVKTTTNGGAGGSGGGVGSGGAGGVGAGYNSSAGGSNAGSAGSAGNWGGGGGTNAGSGGQGGTGGTGGTGGAGGALGANGTAGAQGSQGAQGNSGANGNSSNGSAGSAGTQGSAGGTAGTAGYYIKDPSSAVTLTNNGTVAGNS
tara:strand:+ start:17839 stop:19224 length:1386 start_codon:yes stop_codon:yes gene_type:complete